MLGMSLVLSRQRSTYNWFEQCRAAYQGRNIIKHFHVHSSIAQYCVSVKDKEKNLSQVKEIEYKSTKVNRLRFKTKSEKFTEENFNQFETNHNDSQRINKDNMIKKRVERLYSDPKCTLDSIYAIVGHELKDKTVLTSKYKNIKNFKVWEITLNVKWPEVMSFKEIGKTKALCFKNAAWKCLQWLELNGKLKNGKPIMYDQTDLRSMLSKPIALNIELSSEMLNNISHLVQNYQDDIAGVINNTENLARDRLESSFVNDYNDLYNIKNRSSDNVNTFRNKILKDRVSKRQFDEIVTLPIHEFKDDILSKLENNRVLLIEGDTGCGKTTQVPQFILDSFAQNGNATDCNILISQPRRISAISLADRIACERKEDVGDVVGFQVKLEQVLPKELGSIVFCTTGILLRKLQFNPNLEGYSHVILDEAHERTIDTDILMNLLKRCLEKNPSLKVLIMSATINTHMFQQYFDCPVVRVPGRLYSVKMNFLEDIQHLPNIEKYRTYAINPRYNDEVEKLSVDFEKIVQVIKWISMHKPPGAILCFLPGWAEITKVQSMIEDTSSCTANFLILPMHSKISHNEQRKIFEHTPADVRKIILATDIAETGITVSDVVYVVDSAIRKESRWDADKDLPSISNCWVSRANIQQRKGRAGRVKPGESYHLISKREYENLDAHPIPELLRNPLEKVILTSKAYTLESAEQFLNGFLEPPTSSAIKKGVKYLMDLGAMSDKEYLTPLGKRMLLFPTYPKFSKAMVLSTIFNCMHPVTTIATIFSSEDSLFHNVLDKKSEIRKNKKIYHPFSDHIAMAWIFKQWYTCNETTPSLTQKFCYDMRLRPYKIRTLNKIRDTYIQQLIQCRMLPKDTKYLGYKSNIEVNEFENNDELVQAVLYAATQQLIEQKNIGFKNGIIRKGVNTLRIQGRAKAVISGESVNYNRKVWPSSFLTYFNAAHCQIRRSTVIRETSVISPLTVLLFAAQEMWKFECHKLDDNKAEIVMTVNDNKYTLRFACDSFETATLLLQFKYIVRHLVDFLLIAQGYNLENLPDTVKILQYKKDVFKTLGDLLKASAEPIENVTETSLKD
ncbi:hypothetical protein PUN28_009500 [Cardiocondyla obscurior]|uniref:RNA helicase n=1 Tax=Cardiocondyla obscurior TaxID=286306 RepID=A0AAW2FSG3_9HYME